MNKETFRILDYKSSIMNRLIRILANYCFLGFCIYLSQGSTWWTFLTGSAFIFSITVQALSLFSESKTFKNKAELLAWAEGLEDR